MLATYSVAQDIQEIQIANEYFSKGQNEKALEAYQVLVKSPLNIPSVHNNYFNLLMNMGKLKQAEDYIEKLIRRENKFSYRLDLGILYMKQGDQAKADKYFKGLLKANSDDVYRMKTAADYLSSYNLLEYATEALLQARATGGRMLYNLELANLYRLQGKRTEMINVYLDYVTQIPSNISYTKNLLQVLLTKPEELETLEQVRTENYLPAELGIIKAREAKVKKTFPVNRDSVRYLIGEYRKFKNRNSGNANSDEADLSASMLHAYYLDELDSAVIDLSALVINPKISAQLKAQAKINLGDIYLLKGEPWESTLLYSQVEKSQHESPLGYEAKLRNAKLWYFNGEFKLAEEHLNILKQATTREIANDAMDLSMRIKENITFDTTGAALKEFSHIELLVYQNKLDEAVKKLEDFKSETSPGIIDDVYWLEANLLMKEGKFVESIAKLQKILNEFGEDILADDAYFLQGDIYEHQLKNKNKAMEIYREFLNKYPGSVYAAEARKRYRVLRGDFADTPNQ
jgi:tetratricopeptide (TPR) repeat protein